MRLGFEGREWELADGETVLDCLDRHGAGVPSYCRNGVCQTCLLRVEEGDIPAAAQQGLKDAWRAQGWFLSCVCRPAGDLRVARCDGASTHETTVLEVKALSDRVLRVRLARPAGFAYAAGQFIQIVRPADGLMRLYSLASMPDEATLELHVARLPMGRMSGWLAGAVGERLQIRGPYGDCFYLQEPAPRPLLLAGTGTGLAPLYGVLRTALACGHAGSIHLLHGASSVEGLYLWDELNQLAARHPQLKCTGSVLHGEAIAGVNAVPLQELVRQSGVPWRDARIYLCGSPDFVRTLRRDLYLAGAALGRIHADPFLPPADSSN